jgi:cation diffusion facilitator CzcD-associated flavoprotein CzcO
VFLLGGESMTKTIIIGANHSGIAAANTILDNDPNHE